MRAIFAYGNSTLRIALRLAVIALASLCVMSVAAQEDQDFSTMSGVDANEEGKRLYRAKDYDAALPYLQLASEWGFKDAQFRLGQIYFKGLGATERNPLRGLAWLGTAASKPTSPQMEKGFQSSLEKVSEEHRAAVDRTVAAYAKLYGSGAAAVTCRMQRPLGSNLSQLACDYDKSYSYTKPAKSAWEEHESSAFAL